MRAGLPERYSPSPYLGLELSVHIPEDFAGKRADLYSVDKEYNADTQKPDWFSDEYVESYNRDSLEESFNPSSGKSPAYRRFFDGDHKIPYSYLTRYVENLNRSILIHATNGVRSYNKNNEAAFFIKDEEEGNYISPAELAIQDEFEFEQADFAWAIKWMPYVVKRLFYKSQALGIHVFSLIHAYANATIEGSDKVAMRSRLVGEDGAKAFILNRTNGEVYLTEIDKTGKTYTERLPKALDWLTGVVKDDYTQDLAMYLKCCDILDIDIREEDPMIYTADYVSNTLSLPEIVDSLQGISISKHELLDSMKSNPQMFNNYNDTAKVKQPKSSVRNTMDLIDFLHLSMPEDEDSVNSIYVFMSILETKGLPVEKVHRKVESAYKFAGGVLVSMSGLPFVFPVSIISEGAGICLICDRGYVVQVTNSETTLVYATVMEAMRAAARPKENTVTWRVLR